MNQHNEHILLRYAQTRQAEQAQEALDWQAAHFGRRRGSVMAGAVVVAAVVAAILMVLSAF